MRCNLHACVGKSPGKHTESEHENAVALKKLNFCPSSRVCVGAWLVVRLATRPGKQLNKVAARCRQLEFYLCFACATPIGFLSIFTSKGKRAQVGGQLRGGQREREREGSSGYRQVNNFYGKQKETDYEYERESQTESV